MQIVAPIPKNPANKATFAEEKKEEEKIEEKILFFCVAILHPL